MKRYYKIAFCGMGSIGRRHLLNVTAYLDAREESYTIDLYRSSLSHTLDSKIEDKVRHQYLLSDSIPKSRYYDIVFITNPTSMHLETLRRFQGHAQWFFIEKPVFARLDEGAEEFMEIPNAYVACPLRYSPTLQWIHEHIIEFPALSVRALSSSYLPDWRPGQDYRLTYSAHRDMGGGVGIDLIHEWDYITWLFGQPIMESAIQARYSSLEIDSDDIAIYIARTSTTAIEVHLDYIGRVPRRMLEIITPEDTIICDLQHAQIDFLRSGRHLDFNAARNDFQKAEIAHFFAITRNEIPNDSTIVHALQVLKLALCKS